MIPFIVLLRRFRLALRESLYRSAAMAGIVILYGTLSEYYLENHIPGSGIKSIFDSFWWVMQTVTTVGYGDTPVVGFYGRLNAIFIMVFGIGSLGYFTASLAANLMDAKIAKKFGEVKLKMKDHTIIINIGENLSYILKELNDAGMEVVVVGESDPKINGVVYEFVKGDPLNLDTLNRAGIESSSSVIILPHRSDGDPNDVDARTILNAMIVKKQNNHAYIIAMLINEDNAQHAKSVGIDEVVIRGSMSTLLLVNSAISPGVSKLFYELLRSDDGYRIRERRIPNNLYKGKINDVYSYFERENSVVLALRRGNEIRIRPREDEINNFDYAIIMEPKSR